MALDHWAVRIAATMTPPFLPGSHWLPVRNYWPQASTPPIAVSSSTAGTSPRAGWTPTTGRARALAADTGTIVFSVDYRLAPSAAFPPWPTTPAPGRTAWAMRR